MAEKNVNNKTISEYTGVSTSSVAKTANGSVDALASNYAKISAMLGINLNCLKEASGIVEIAPQIKKYPNHKGSLPRASKNKLEEMFESLSKELSDLKQRLGEQ
jgi:DNA-binding Xre family transcriptional regulator